MLGESQPDAAAAVQRYQALGYSGTAPVDLEFPDAEVGGVRESFSARYVFVDTGNNLLIELIEPLSESVYTRFLAERGEAVHHIGYHVENFDENLALAEEIDGAYVAVRAPIPGHGRFAYVAGITPGPILEFIDAGGTAESGH